jgi:hypothetical protein
MREAGDYGDPSSGLIHPNAVQFTPVMPQKTPTHLLDIIADVAIYVA